MGIQATPARFFQRWVLYNFAGWIGGVIAVLVVSAIGEQLHVGNQFAIGVGMGFGIGYAQWRAGRSWFGAPAGWMWASLAGMAAPFVISDLLRIWRDGAQMVPLLLLNAGVGGIIAALLQRRFLRGSPANSGWWILVSAAAWILAAATPLAIVLGRHPSSLLEAIRNIGGLALGGIVLGAVTGLALLSLVRSHDSSAPDNGFVTRA